MVQDGYNFDFDRRVVTVFSAPNYQNMDNAGGIMTVDEQLMCSFKILKPTVDKKAPAKVLFTFFFCMMYYRVLYRKPDVTEIALMAPQELARQIGSLLSTV